MGVITGAGVPDSSWYYSCSLLVQDGCTPERRECQESEARMLDPTPSKDIASMLEPAPLSELLIQQPDVPGPFGNYYLLEHISTGGMAEIFRAAYTGLEGFERTVAIKMLLPSMSWDEMYHDMLVDEARICSLLNHANIVKVYDLGRVGHYLYIAMEYVRGKTLHRLFHRSQKSMTQLPLPMVCFVVMKICSALEYAHGRTDPDGQTLGIVHRDISLPNVIISYTGEVKLIDFGIAKATGRRNRTQKGILKGKYQYMSPEQVKGDEVDHRSDIFSTGTVLYELLTLCHPFRGDTPFQILSKIYHAEVPPPSQHKPDIPADLERIVLKAMARCPEDRFQSAGEFYDALQQFIFDHRQVYSSRKLSDFMSRSFGEELIEEQLSLARLSGQTPSARESWQTARPKTWTMPAIPSMQDFCSLRAAPAPFSDCETQDLRLELSPELANTSLTPSWHA